MLVLTRRVGDSIVIPTTEGRVEVKIGKPQSGRNVVKLLITSPPSIRVLRGELLKEDDEDERGRVSQ